MVRTQSSPAPKSNSSARQNGSRATSASANGATGPAATAVRTVAHQHSNGLESLKSAGHAQPPPHISNSVTAAPSKPSSKPRTNGHTQPRPAHSHQAPTAAAPTPSRTRPVTESADTAFESGAWLFDASRMPAWLAQQLQPSAGLSSSGTPVKAAVVKGKQQQTKTSGATRQKQQQPAGEVIRLGSRPVREQPADIGFDSGAWLYDESQRPEWLSCELRATTPVTSGRSSRSQRKRTPPTTDASDTDRATPPSPKHQPSSHAQAQAQPPANPLAMSWAEVAASPPSSPNRTFAARPPTKHRDLPSSSSSSSKRSRSVPHRRIQRNAHHLARPTPSTTTAASTTQALDLPPSDAHDAGADAAAAAYTLHSSDPTYPLSLPAAHARMHVLHYAHRAAGDCGPVPGTSDAAERVRESMHVRAARALATFAVVCLVLSVSLAGLVARTGRPLVPARVGARWVANGGRAGGHLVVGVHGARERAEKEQAMSRRAWVVEADEDGVQGKVIYA